MPWHRKSTKGAASRDRPGGGANGPRSRDSRMGEPSRRHGRLPRGGHPAGGQPGELKHLSTPRRGNQTETPPVAASERGPAQTGRSAKRADVARPGLRARRPVAAPTGGSHKAASQRKTHGKARGTGLEPRTRSWLPPGSRPRVPPGTRNPAGSRGDRPPRLSTPLRPTVDQYREGKVKSTPGGE